MSVVELYVLGAAYDVGALEDKFRPFIIRHFDRFVNVQDRYFSQIAKRRPFKLLQLVSDGVASLETRSRMKIQALRDHLARRDTLLSRCKLVHGRDGSCS